MTHHRDDEIREQLHATAGVRPSLTWLHAFRLSQNPQLSHIASVDSVLQLILYHDLRDVVRELDGHEHAANSRQTASVQWRQLVQSQQPAANNNQLDSSMKSTLPESFRLMVQVEEIVDVSRNAEMRLQGPNAAISSAGYGNGNPLYQNHQRCLKLCLSDGYYENGCVRPDGNNSLLQDAIIAMEVSSIPSLAVGCKAGMKILLHGPIDIRWGVLLLNEGNTLVLGGEVSRMMERQAKALEDAKRAAGVGVDPTVRALIWNPDTGGELDEDEGEQGSSDVAPQRVAPMRPSTAAQSTLNPPPVTMPAAPSALRDDRNNPQNGRYNSSQPNHESMPSQQRSNATSNPYCSNISSNAGPGSRSSTSVNSSSGITPRATRPLPQQQNQNQRDATAAYRQQPQQMNPYARKNSSRSQNSGATRSSSPTIASGMLPGAGALPQRIAANRAAIPDVKMADAVDAIHPKSVSPQGSEATANPSNQVRSSPDTTPRLSPTQNENSQDVSFISLRTLLDRARQDQSFYRQQYGKVFRVPMKQTQKHHYFNIEKVKKEDRRKEDKKRDKYTYVIHAQFSGASSNEGLVSCAIVNDILEPYFGMPPGEMRKLNRTDRAKGQSLTSQSGKRMNDVFYKPGLWDVTLHLPPDEYFNSSQDSTSFQLDSKRPILLLLKRQSG